MATKRIDISLFDDNLKATLNSKADINTTYTKAEIDTRIQNVIGLAPANLDTLQELATALANDQNFASTMVTSLNSKVDNVAGKALSTEDFTTAEKTKLSGIATSANNYVHPASHPASVVTQDASNRFVTDTEKTTWNGKASASHTHTKANITDFPTLATVATSGAYADLSGKPVVATDTNQLTKTDVYTKTEVGTLLTGKSDTTHNHDGRYSTPAQLALKSDTTHNHDTAYAVKSIENTVATNTTNIATNTADILTIQTNVANGDSHSNISVLNQLTQALLDAWNSAVTHISDAVKHITGAERTAWNAKADVGQIPTTVSALTNDSGYQTSANVATAISGKADKSYVDTGLSGKVDTSTFSGHTGNSTIHVLQTDKDSWNGKASGTHTHVKANITDFPASLPANGGNADTVDSKHASDFYQNGSVIMNTNPFGGNKLFINGINNAMFNAHKRWTVTGSIYNSDDSLNVALTPSQLSTLFDGNYETYINIPANKYIIVDILFNTEVGGNYPGYPYGNLYLSHYNTGFSQSATVDVYCNYAPHGIGWKTLTFSDFIRNGTTNLITKTNNTFYAISEMKFKIYAPSATIASVSQVDFQLDRPSTNEMPLLDKYTPNKLYYDLNMLSNKVTNVATPVSNTDVANKQYVDNNAITLGVTQPATGFWFKQV